MGTFDISLFNNTAAQQIQSLMDASAAASPRNAEGAGQPAASVAPQASSPGSVAEEIARLVKSAVGRNVAAVTAEELQGAAKSLEQSADFKAALGMVQDAQDKLCRVGRFTGRQLMEAFRPASGDDRTAVYASDSSASRRVRDQLEAAVSAQEELSEHLCNLLSQCADADEQQLLENMMLRADSRASELSTLAIQLSELAGSDDVDAQASLGGAKVRNLAAGLVGSMHGNLETAAALGTDRETNAILEDIADFARTVDAVPEQGDSQKTVAGLLNRAAELRTRLAAPGFRDSPLRAELLRQLDDGRANIQARAQKALSGSVNRLSDTALKAFDELKSMTTGDVWKTCFQDTSLDELVLIETDLKSALKAFADNPTPDNLKACSGALQDLKSQLFGPHGNSFDRLTGYARVRSGLSKFYQQMDAMKAQIDARAERLGQFGPEEENAYYADVLLYEKLTDEKTTARLANGQTAEVMRQLEPDEMLDKILGYGDRMKQRLDQLQVYLDKMSSPDKFLEAGFAGVDLEQLLVSDNPVLGIVEARVCGAQPEMIESTCLDQHRTSMVPLGSGAANEVSLVTYQVPGSDKVEKRVFKGEIDAQCGTTSLTLRRGAWQNQQQIAKLNFAATSTARFLGTEEAVAKTTLGTCNGQYGLFMELAPGKEAGTFAKALAKREDLLDVDDMSQDDKAAVSMMRKIAIGGYSPADPAQRKFVASLLKGTVDLSWNDLLAGQGDRHPQNYMVGLLPDGTVRVTGIDNDMCFPAYKPGLQTFVCNDPRTENNVVQFIKDSAVNPQCDDRVKLEQERDASFKKLLDDPGSGVSRNEKGQLTIKVTKSTSPNVVNALANGVGVRSLALPPFMSRAMHDRLNDAGARAQLVATWEKTLGPDSLAAAKARLEELVALSNSGQVKILENDEDWGSPEVVSTLKDDFNKADTGVKTDSGLSTTQDAQVMTRFFTKNLAIRDFSFLFEKLNVPGGAA